VSGVLHGSCLCGAVQLELAGEPYRVGLCHCLDCRKKTGGIFAPWAMYPAESVRVSGETATHAARDYTRHFCPVCGSPIFETIEGSDEAEVFVGIFDEPNQLKPTYESFTVRREAWLPPLPLARHYERNRNGTGRTEP
jgi:hypothetical protein